MLVNHRRAQVFTIFDILARFMTQYRLGLYHGNIQALSPMIGISSGPNAAYTTRSQKMRAVDGGAARFPSALDGLLCSLSPALMASELSSSL